MTTFQYFYTPYNQIYNETTENSLKIPQFNQIFIDKKPITQRKNWKKEEDEKLLKLIDKYGPHRWKIIAEIIQTKTAKQCRDHYFNCLDPKIKNSLWTVEEEKILLKKYQQYGSHWSKIKRYLPGRTPSMIKAYLRVLLKKKETEKNEEMKRKEAEIKEDIKENETEINEYDKDDISNSNRNDSNFDMSVIENLLNKKNV